MLELNLFPRPEGLKIIRGVIPSKSNCYKIITIKPKDPTKKAFSSLGKTPVLQKYEKAFFMQIGDYRNLNITEPFELHVGTYYPNMRFDLDGCLKILLDCLQKCNAIKNDNLCTRIVADKFIDKIDPRIEFIIKPSMRIDAYKGV